MRTAQWLQDEVTSMRIKEPSPDSPTKKTTDAIIPDSPFPEHSSFRAMLSLAYFDDAEAQPMPKMFNSVQWEGMKRFILKAVEEYNASF